MDLHAVELAVAALGVPFVHAGCLMLQVEDFLGCDTVTAYGTTILVEEGGNKLVAHTSLAVIDGEPGADLKHAVHRCTYGNIAQADIGGVIEQYIAVDAAEAPEVLVFKIGAVAVFVDFDGYLVLTSFYIGGHIELRGFHGPLTIAHALAVDPNVEGRHHALKAEEGLSRGFVCCCITATNPTVGHGERTAILAGGVALLIGGPLFLGLLGDVGWVNFERVACRYIDRCAVAVHLPVGRNSQRCPRRGIEVGTIEVLNTLIGGLRPPELPVTVET